MTPVLDAAGLRKSFGGQTAVDDVSFRVGAGEIRALIGPNGAGKSTCFNLLNGQLRPDGGSVRLHGRDITGLPPWRIARLGVGRTFQITATFASMTVRENVQTALLSHRRRIWRCGRPARSLFRAEADGLLRQVHLPDQADRAAGVLAYGDLKRLELAIALAGQPVLLLMDEPTAGMAPAERGALMRLVRALTRQQAIAVLFTEHDMDVVFGTADRIMVLDHGRLIADGDPAAVRANPRVRAVYLGSVGPGSIDPGSIDLGSIDPGGTAC
ncbi:ABC transporter ATP-binding protein [Rhodopila sp.]|jgi:branched-chain amino acid transport system ATP-binding protein|uniref:ABC transporter ATP-binding protein n=1 Tax=Rhodopila sp. TaxID=2480087 RepID=UPI002BF1CE76|nr:ABC transporter ATP-binding protein [Rhodopila sp.]HVZ09886.1 ABC transporter ATP-binding protein [Rhodopila sp.]